MSVRNVYIFVADALRNDYLQDGIEDLGVFVSTISAGTNSPEGFSSIVSGLYPSQHETYSFTNRLDRNFNYLNFVSEQFDTRFFQKFETELSNVLGMEQDTRNPIGNLEDPFIVLERDMTTHAPYDHSDYEDVEIPDGRFDRMFDFLPIGKSHPYFRAGNVDIERIRSDYLAASQTVAERFTRRVSELDEQGLLDETLVIFTSDHGELLGEYGERSHDDPLVPELVQVPTVVIHPDDRAIEPNLISHVDIVPTVVDVLGEPKPWTFPGRSIYSEGHGYKMCEHRSEPHSLEESSLQNLYEYSVRSVWDEFGGHAFNDTTLPGKTIHAIRQLPLFNPLRGVYAMKSVFALYHHLMPSRSFGDPDITPREAKDFIREMDEFPIQLTKESHEISEQAKEELRRLGYL